MKDTWYKIFSTCLVHLRVRTQVEKTKDWSAAISKAVFECTPKNYKHLVTIVKNLSKTMFKAIGNDAMYKKLFSIIHQVHTVLDSKRHAEAIYVMHSICEAPNGRVCFMECKYLARYVRRLFGSEEAADKVASLVVMFIHKCNPVLTTLRHR
eukprot:TRINITY_DN1683_c0_g3_i3.p2 TRINITY_DN1683_c0_g3~~TRINITY_DN1683_c0_g3_i3.p2  ORF type:complete len:152 (+),score=34.91 TRINITY_DN1683_c0_g3_i3:704-1159(+)